MSCAIPVGVMCKWPGVLHESLPALEWIVHELTQPAQRPAHNPHDEEEVKPDDVGGEEHQDLAPSVETTALGIVQGLSQTVGAHAGARAESQPPYDYAYLKEHEKDREVRDHHFGLVLVCRGTVDLRFIKWFGLARSLNALRALHALEALHALHIEHVGLLFHTLE